jgi:L-fuconolactonase
VASGRHGAGFLVIVDAHHHFWNPARISQGWMTREHEAINRAFEPPDLEPLLAALDVAATVLVQSAANDRDTDYMFELVDDVPWVGAVTAWCRLDDVGAARARLDALAPHPKLRGIRHLIHTEVDPHWLLRAEVQPALALLEERGLLLELPAVFPDHLGDVPELASRYPALTLVVDHLGKPPIGSVEMPVWQEQLERAAASSNVVAKVSGLNTMVPWPEWGAGDLEPAVRAALDAFGSERLLFGSDWPVALLNGSYEHVFVETTKAIRSVAGESADAILGGNALRLYAIGLR